MNERDEPTPEATLRVLADIEIERKTHARRGYDTQHDLQHGIHHLVTWADKYAHGVDNRTDGYYRRKDLVKAASLLVAAIEAMDAPEPR